MPANNAARTTTAKTPITPAKSALTCVGKKSAPPPIHGLSELAFLRLPDVVALAGLRSSTIYDLIRDGKFPAPHKITARASGWRTSEINHWLASPLDWAPQSRKPDGE